jgi:hypothetical protein
VALVPSLGPLDGAGPENEHNNDDDDGEIRLEAFLPERTKAAAAVIPEEDVTKYVERRKPARPTIVALAAVGVLMAGGVIGLSVGLTRKVPRASPPSQPTESPFPSQGPVSSPAPSVSPTIYETSSVFPLVADQVRTEFGIDSYKRLQEDHQSPQARAARWIGEADVWFTFPIPMEDEEQRRHFRQRYALATFYYGTGGEGSWVLRGGFLSDPHECYWRSQQWCDPSNTRVLRLYMPDNNLTGTIPEEIRGLEDLEKLVLDLNSITGPIPDGLYSLTNLTYVTIPHNRVSGTVSTLIGNLVNLLYWWTEDSNLTGTLPSEIGHLTRLDFFAMISASLTGTLPAELSSLSNLTDFRIQSTQLTGTLPPWVSEMPLMDVLYLNDNLFTGPIPAGEYPAVRDAAFYGNMLTGTLPQSLLGGNMEVLLLDSNSLTGRLPEDWSAATNLSSFNISKNAFTGSLPPSMGLLTGLTMVTAYGNQLTGPLVDLGNSTALVELFVPINQLTGTVPDSYLSLPSLKLFAVAGNRLVGDLSGMCAPAPYPVILVDCPPVVVW